MVNIFANWFFLELSMGQVDPDRGSEYRGGSLKQGSGRCSLPGAIGCFILKTPKSCVMQDLEHT